MSQSDDNKVVSYKAIVGGLIFLLISAVIYIFTTNVSAQNATNDKQDQAILDIRTNVQKLTESNLLLTQIVQDDHAQLKTLKNR